jgi:hypothetical protein
MKSVATQLSYTQASQVNSHPDKKVGATVATRGPPLGISEGEVVGLLLGVEIGEDVRLSLGPALGIPLGILDGDADDPLLGSKERATEGLSVGLALGLPLGTAEGTPLGSGIWSD